MLRQLSIIALSAGIMVTALLSCKHEPFNVTKGNYPAEISGIMINKCATSGCHDAAGAVNAAKLRLDSWDELFKGSSHGAVVVPYSPKYSTLLYYINLEAHSNSDIVATPTMPYNMSPLTEGEYNTIKNWIANGAPDASGNVAFSGDEEKRQKIYMTQQGCNDLLTVVDAKTGLVMRHVEIGASNNSESAHFVRLSKDGRYAYVCFTAGLYVQKIDTRTDKPVGSAQIGLGSWNVVYLSDDGSKLLVSDLANDRLTLINTADMTVINNNYLTGLNTAHGIVSTPNFDTIYVTSQETNIVYRFTPNDQLEPLKELYLKGTEAILGYTPGNPNPHEILMSPDRSKLFVSCESTNDVRVLDIATEQVVDIIPVGTLPKELALSEKRGLLFVTCTEDAANNYSAKSRGSVYAININTLEQHGGPIYGDFYQPHGIAVDDENDRLFIVSRNVNPNGPAPHHSSGCDGRNGWYSIYDLNTLQPVNNIRYEVTPDPYGAAVRFK